MDTQRSQFNSNSGIINNDYAISSMDFARVAENRSLYGNYVDNSLAYDPNKDKRSVYDIVYAPDVYDPWGKPGGGAPIIDRRTGRLKTKIEGRLQWNLDGTTNSAKNRKIKSNVKVQPNLIEYRRTPSPVLKKPLNFEATTYRQVFGGIDNTNNLQLLSSRASRERNIPAIDNNLTSLQSQQQQKSVSTNLEREAEARNLNRYLKSNEQNRPNNMLHSNVTPRTNYDVLPTPGRGDFNSNNNFNNSSQFNDQSLKANEYSKWFGNVNGGGGAPTNDARRRKLLDMLENRHLHNQDFSERRAQSDFIFAKSNTRSSHKNMYDGPLQQ